MFRFHSSTVATEKSEQKSTVLGTFLVREETYRNEIVAKRSNAGRWASYKKEDCLLSTLQSRELYETCVQQVLLIIMLRAHTLTL